MSVKVSSWVWQDKSTQDLKGSQMVVLLALADIANDDGEVTFIRKGEGDQKALAKKARVSVASFRRLTQSLEELGLLEVSRENQTSPNRYRIVMTAQNERLQVSGQSAQDERSQRLQVSGHSSIDVINVDIRGDAANRGTRIPQPFLVDQDMVVWAHEHAPDVDGKRSTERFENYWLAKTGKDATKLDWLRTWRNWLLKDQEEAERRGARKLTPSERAQRTLALAGEQLEIGA